VPICRRSACLTRHLEPRVDGEHYSGQASAMTETSTTSPVKAFWICCVVAMVTVAIGVFAGSIVGGAFEGLFFFLAGIGVRERSRVAAIAAFCAYLLSALVAQRYTGSGFGFVRIVFLALLFANIRGNWLSAGWTKDSQALVVPMRLKQTIGDKFADELPTFLWPKARFVFYVLAGLEMASLLFLLFRPSASPIDQ